MDKEAEGFISVDAMNGLSWLTEHDRTPTWRELDRFIRALGYRKLPQDKPPLLSDEEIIKVATSIIRGTDAQAHLNKYRPVAQAQRELDIKHYENPV